MVRVCVGGLDKPQIDALQRRAEFVGAACTRDDGPIPLNERNPHPWAGRPRYTVAIETDAEKVGPLLRTLHRPLAEAWERGRAAHWEERVWYAGGTGKPQTGETGCQTQAASPRVTGSEPLSGSSEPSASVSPALKPRSTGSCKRSGSQPTSGRTSPGKTRKRSGTSTGNAPRPVKAKPDPLSEMREALRLMFEAGELSDDEIAAAKAKGML